jgi:hypothetical protein
MAANKTTEGAAREPLLLERAVHWTRQQLQSAHDARGLPSLRRPAPVKLHPPRRSWLSGWWTARLAAASSIRPDEFLRHRLSHYLSAVPVSPDRLPVVFRVDEVGNLSAEPHTGERSSPPWLETYLRANGYAAVQSDVLLAQGEVARLSADLQDHAPQLERARREAEEASREPTIAELDGGSLEALGRPPVPPPWSALIQGFGLLLLLGEAWQLAVPVLESSGVKTNDLVGEALANPAGVALASVFALGAAVSLFLIVDQALRRVRTLFEALPAAPRARWAAASATAAFGFAAAVSWSIAGLRPGTSHVDPQYARFTLFLLALALPVTTSLLLQVARRLRSRRADALAAAVAWDQVRYRALAGYTHKAGSLAAEEREHARLEKARDTAIRRLRALRARAQLAERYAGEVAAAEAQELDRITQVIASALELDRYELLRHLASREVPQPRPAARRDREHTLGLAG